MVLYFLGAFMGVDITYTMPEKLIGDTLLSDQKLKRVTNIGSVTRVHKTRH